MGSAAPVQIVLSFSPEVRSQSLVRTLFAKAGHGFDETDGRSQRHRDWGRVPKVRFTNDRAADGSSRGEGHRTFPVCVVN